MCITCQPAAIPALASDSCLLCNAAHCVCLVSYLLWLPVAAGTQHKPGVYLAGSTTLADAAGDAQGYAAAMAALSPRAAAAAAAAASRGGSSKSPGSRSSAAGSGATAGAVAAGGSSKLGSPLSTGVTPLMYSGKPATLHGAAAANAATAYSPQQLQQLQRLQEEAADAAVRQIIMGSSCSSSQCEGLLEGGEAVMRSSGGLGSSLRSHAYDVYGQPRAAQVSLPASHLKVRGCGASAVWWQLYWQYASW